MESSAKEALRPSSPGLANSLPRALKYPFRFCSVSNGVFWRVWREAKSPASPLLSMVGATGFEPATPWSQTKCATKLRHAPTIPDLHAKIALAGIGMKAVFILTQSLPHFNKSKRRYTPPEKISCPLAVWPYQEPHDNRIHLYPQGDGYENRSRQETFGIRPGNIKQCSFFHTSDIL